MVGKHLFSRETFLITFGLTDTRAEPMDKSVDLQRRRT